MKVLRVRKFMGEVYCYNITFLIQFSNQKFSSKSFQVFENILTSDFQLRKFHWKTHLKFPQYFIRYSADILNAFRITTINCDI